MADEEQLARLRGGVGEWNRWRCENATVPINLVGADLTKADLSLAILNGANLARAKLPGTVLFLANLTAARLPEAILTRADLSDANLADASLAGACLVSANLTGTCLYRTTLTGADLTDAILRGALGLRFDDNPIRGARFTARPEPWHSWLIPPPAVPKGRLRRMVAATRHVAAKVRAPFALTEEDDPWSLLRRRYTGANLVLIWLALLAALLPRLLTTVGLYLLVESQSVAADVILVALDVGQSQDPVLAETIAAKYRVVDSHPVWQVALGVHQGGFVSFVWAALIFVLLVYAGVRFWLTLRVLPLVDAETRSAVTPRLADYWPLYQIHKVLVWVWLPALAFTLVTAVRLLGWMVTTRVELFGR